MLNFKCRETEKIWKGVYSRKLPSEIQQIARRKLRMIDAAIVADDLKSPPGNKLEALKGDRKDQYSIRINNQWRICFFWEQNQAVNIEIVDYH